VSGAAAWRIARGSSAYPPGLSDLGERAPGAPAVLFGLGARELVAGLEPRSAVTIVGARRASPYGREIAHALARDLAAAGLVVVSGMAHGVDAAAHSGALAGEGATVAVLGGGPDVVYPPGQRRLYRRILAGGGAILSEARPGERPARWSFPARNRIMAALSELTIVVEATERSGTRITADWALELGQRSVGAVPGPVNSRLSAGPNGLLAEGAAPIRDAQDVLDQMIGVGAVAARASGPALEPPLARLLDLVERGAGGNDELAIAAGLAPGDAAVALARLELLGYVRSDASGRPIRTALPAPEHRTGAGEGRPPRS
jgi:DNA processing protein